MKSTLILSMLLLVVLVLPDALFAQPPGLPGAPNQAPIDGGLSLLAVAGGAYAWNKLKSRTSK